MIFEKNGEQLTREQFETLTGAQFLSELKDPRNIKKPTQEAVWLGAYFHREILHQILPDVSIRWIDPIMGWGVFANRDFKKMEFIAEYTGIVRKKSSADRKNSYCFEYIDSTNIDASLQGGVSRYINHSFTPNLASALAYLDGSARIILYTKEPILKNAQLCYDYGSDYWKHRAMPR